MSTDRKADIVLLPSSPLILEVHSERFLELQHAIVMAGFRIKNAGPVNRFRIEDKVPRK